MSNTVPFSMRIDADLKARLSAEAERTDRPSTYLANKAIEDFLSRQERERELLRQRLKEAQAGVFVSEERVSEWVNSWFTDAELARPDPDVVQEKS